MRIAIVVLAVVLMASCRSTRNIQTVIAKKDTVAATEVAVAKIDTAQLIRAALVKLDSTRIDFQTFTGKIDIDYRGGNDKRYDVNANIRMYKDSAIWVSISAVLGIEAMRALITKDSVFLLDKLNKTYTARSVDYLQEVTALPLTLSTLQNLLVGNPVFLDNNNIVSYGNNNNVITLLSIGKWFKNLLTVNAGSNTLMQSKLDDVDIARNRTANLSYEDYENKRGKPFSTKRRIAVSEKTKLDIALNFRNYEFNEAVSFPFSIPKNYKQQ